MTQLCERLCKITATQSSDTQDGHSVPKYCVKNPPVHPLRMSSSADDKIVEHLKKYLNAQQIEMFSNTCFGKYLNIPTCTFQAQMARCFMTLEVKQDNNKEFWIMVNGTVLRFTILEFALITGLNCTGSEEDFDYSNSPTNRLKRDYFNGLNHVRKIHLVKCFEEQRWGNNSEDGVKIAILYFIHTFLFSKLCDDKIPNRDFHLVDSGRYNQFPWGKLSFNELIPTFRQTMNFTQKLYRLSGMPYALQVWFYECCSHVPPSIAIHEGDLIPRILNWCVVDPQPKFSTLMQAMFSNEGNKMSYRNITPTANEVAILDLPRTIDPAVEYLTSRVPVVFDDFTSTTPVNLYKRAIQDSGPSTEPPPRKQKTNPVPPTVRSRTPRVLKSVPIKSKSKHHSHYPRHASEPQIIKQKEIGVSSSHAHHKQPIDTEQHQPVTVDIQRGDTITTNQETTGKQAEDSPQMEDLESFKKYVDNRFQDLCAYMDGQFSLILQAIKDNSRTDSKGNDNVNDGAHQHTDAAHVCKTVNPNAATDNVVACGDRMTDPTEETRGRVDSQGDDNVDDGAHQHTDAAHVCNTVNPNAATDNVVACGDKMTDPTEETRERVDSEVIADNEKASKEGQDTTHNVFEAARSTQPVHITTSTEEGTHTEDQTVVLNDSDAHMQCLLNT